MGTWEQGAKLFIFRAGTHKWAAATTIGKLEYKVEKLRDKAEAVADHVADCRLELIGVKFHDEAEARNYRDTHIDLSMEMRILHNKSRDYESITLLTTSILQNLELGFVDLASLFILDSQVKLTVSNSYRKCHSPNRN